jgi:hypothetical protein
VEERGSDSVEKKEVGERCWRKFGQDVDVQDFEDVTVYKLADAGDDTRREAIGREVHGI